MRLSCLPIKRTPPTPKTMAEISRKPSQPLLLHHELENEATERERSSKKKAITTYKSFTSLAKERLLKGENIWTKGRSDWLKEKRSLFPNCGEFEGRRGDSLSIEDDESLRRVAVDVGALFPKKVKSPEDPGQFGKMKKTTPHAISWRMVGGSAMRAGQIRSYGRINYLLDRA